MHTNAKASQFYDANHIGPFRHAVGMTEPCVRPARSKLDVVRRPVDLASENRDNPRDRPRGDMLAVQRGNPCSSEVAPLLRKPPAHVILAGVRLAPTTRRCLNPILGLIRHACLRRAERAHDARGMSPVGRRRKNHQTVQTVQAAEEASSQGGARRCAERHALCREKGVCACFTGFRDGGSGSGHAV